MDNIVEQLRQAHTLKPAELKISDTKWKFAIRAVLRGSNLLVQGDSGCGKTMLVQMLQKIFPDRPGFSFTLGAAQDPRSTLIGNTHFRKETGTYVAEALFVKAIQTPNAIILLDEVSRAHPDATNILMTVLDQRQRYLRIDEHPDTPTISVASGVCFLGTANEGTEYTATRRMDRAFIDRWEILLMDPLSKDDEVALLTALHPTVDAYLVKAIAEIADDTRRQVKSESPRVETILSTRATTEMAALLADGFSLVEAAELKVFPLYAEEGGADSPRAYMRLLVQKYVPDANAVEKPVPWADGSDPNRGHSSPFAKL